LQEINTHRDMYEGLSWYTGYFL